MARRARMRRAVGGCGAALGRPSLPCGAGSLARSDPSLSLALHVRAIAVSVPLTAPAGDSERVDRPATTREEDSALSPEPPDEQSSARDVVTDRRVPSLFPPPRAARRHDLQARDMPLDKDEASVASLEIADRTAVLFQAAVCASAAPLEGGAAARKAAKEEAAAERAATEKAYAAELAAAEKATAEAQRVLDSGASDAREERKCVEAEQRDDAKLEAEAAAVRKAVGNKELRKKAGGAGGVGLSLPVSDNDDNDDGSERSVCVCVCVCVCA